MNELAKQSYNISCDHITKLNDKYNKNNDEWYKRHFNCDNTQDNDDYDKNRKNIKYLKSIYINNKDCIYKSTEPDELEWTANFIDNTNILKYNNDNALALFNENTRRKILTRY